LALACLGMTSGSAVPNEVGGMHGLRSAVQGKRTFSKQPKKI